MATMHTWIPTLSVMLTVLGASASCQRAAQPASQPASQPVSRSGGTASAPRPEQPPGPAELGFRIECFDTYAGCDAVIGLPAISADGRRVAVPDFGPDTGRDDFVLTMRVLDIATGAEVSETPIMTYDDHEAMNLDTGQPSPALRAELEQRTDAFERLLAQGSYQPMTYVGVVHEDQAGEATPGLRATFDGHDLIIADTRAGELLWQQGVGPSTPFTRGDGEVCGPFPVAELHVWVSRDPRAAVARVGYIGVDLCATELPYLVWP